MITVNDITQMLREAYKQKVLVTVDEHAPRDVMYVLDPKCMIPEMIRYDEYDRVVIVAGDEAADVVAFELRRKYWWWEVTVEGRWDTSNPGKEL